MVSGVGNQYNGLGNYNSGELSDRKDLRHVAKRVRWDPSLTSSFTATNQSNLPQSALKSALKISDFIQPVETVSVNTPSLSVRYQTLTKDSLELLQYIGGNPERFERNKENFLKLSHNASKLLEELRTSPSGVAGLSFENQEILMTEWILKIFSSNSFQSFWTELRSSSEPDFLSLLGVSSLNIECWNLDVEHWVNDLLSNKYKNIAKTTLELIRYIYVKPEVFELNKENRQKLLEEATGLLEYLRNNSQETTSLLFGDQEILLLEWIQTIFSLDSLEEFIRVLKNPSDINFISLLLKSKQWNPTSLSARYERLTKNALELLQRISVDPERFEQNKESCQKLFHNASKLLEDSRKTPRETWGVSLGNQEVLLVEWIQSVFSSSSFEKFAVNLSVPSKTDFLSFLGVSKLDAEQWTITLLPTRYEALSKNTLELLQHIAGNPELFEQNKENFQKLFHNASKLLEDLKKSHQGVVVLSLRKQEILMIELIKTVFSLSSLKEFCASLGAPSELDAEQWINTLLSVRYQTLTKNTLKLLQRIAAKPEFFEGNKENCQKLSRNASKLLKDLRKSQQEASGVPLGNEEILLLEWVETVFSANSFERLCANLCAFSEPDFLSILGVSRLELEQWIVENQRFLEKIEKDPLLNSLPQLLVEELEFFFKSNYINLKKNLKIHLSSSLGDRGFYRFSKRSDLVQNPTNQYFKLSSTIIPEIHQLVVDFKTIKPESDLIQAVEKGLIVLLKNQAKKAHASNPLLDKKKLLESVDKYEKSGAISLVVARELKKWENSEGIFRMLQKASEEFAKTRARGAQARP